MAPRSTRLDRTACCSTSSTSSLECPLPPCDTNVALPSTGWWPDVHSSGLDPARQGTGKEDASRSLSGECTSRLIEPLSRTGALQPISLSEGGNPTLPNEGDTKMMLDTQLLLSVEEAAELLRLGRTRTYELVMTRKIQSVKVGRRRLVVRSSVFDFVQALLVEQDCA